MRSEQVCTREDGQLGHTHGELVNFIYWILTFFFLDLLNPPPLPRSNNGRKTPQK